MSVDRRGNITNSKSKQKTPELESKYTLSHNLTLQNTTIKELVTLPQLGENSAHRLVFGMSTINTDPYETQHESIMIPESQRPSITHNKEFVGQTKDSNGLSLDSFGPFKQD